MDQLHQFIDFLQIGRFSFRDAIDILLVALVIYRILLLIRGTLGFHMAVGLIFLIAAYYTTRSTHLQTTHWLLTNFFSYGVFALIVLYQAEIRRGLARIGRNPLLMSFAEAKNLGARYEEVLLAAATLSSKRVGALIIIEREISLRDYVESGIILDAELTYDLLINIFAPNTPLHDGATIVKGNRIAAAVCFLPLTLDPLLSKELGTRHRAAIGITEDTDAVAVVVSEETGQISAVVGGDIQRRLDLKKLRTFLDDAFGPPRRAGDRPRGLKRLYALLKKRNSR